MLKFGTVSAVDLLAQPYPMVQVESTSEGGRIVECHILAAHRDLIPTFEAGDLGAFLEEQDGNAVWLGFVVTQYGAGEQRPVARVGDGVTCPAGGGTITSGSANLTLRSPSS